MEVTSTQYIVNDRKYDRITSVLDCFKDPDLLSWFKRTGPAAIRNASEKALAIGSLVHRCIEEDLGPDRLELTYPDEAMNCWDAWESFRFEKGVVIESQEQWLCDDTLMIAGTRDLLVEVNSVKNITADIKTSRSIRKSYWVQCAMYHYMAGIDWPGALGIVRLDKITGDYEWHTKAYDYRYVELFKSMLTVYRYYTRKELDSF